MHRDTIDALDDVWRLSSLDEHEAAALAREGPGATQNGVFAHESHKRGRIFS